MSTQLILYPQYYNGFNSINFMANEFVVDGQVFNTINGSTSYSTSGSIDSHLTATPPAIINTWYRWRSTGAGTPAFPSETSSNLVLNAVAPSSISGVYQKLSNLTVGANYTLTVNMTAEVGLINLKAYNLTTNSLIATALVTSNTTQQTLSFIAQTTNDAVAILYYNTGATDLTISSISLSPTGQSPTQVYADLIYGQVICDLYEEEDIPLTLSIDDFKNVAEKVQSYSKDFNLPATKRNNRIFNNMFEVTRSVGNSGLIFNPYVKTKCVLKQDGFILFEGYLRLIDVKDKKGEISYNVNLYSDVIALADTLKDKTFSDLDFSELDHSYTYSNIRNSWQGSLVLANPLPAGTFAGTPGASTTGVLKYPFIDWTHQYTPDSSGNPVLPNLESTFRPCIELKYLIDNIFAAAGFTYTSNFFNEVFFGKLFMDFNWGSATVPVIFTNSATSGFPDFISYTAGANTVDFPFVTIPSNFGYSAGVFTAQVESQTYNITYDIEMMSAAGGPYTLTCEWVDSLGNTYNPQTFSPNLVGSTPSAYSGTFSSVPLPVGNTLFCRFTVVSGTITILDNQTSSFTGTTSANNTTNDTLLGTLRGELGQWDFLKGILTMFNLITLVDETNPNNILIEPYADVFINNTRSNNTSDLSLSSRFDGKAHDWTDKVDVSQMELKPLTELNENTIFQFVEDEDDYVFKVYKNSTTGHLYGSKEYDASGFTILEGTKEIIAEPFAATVSKPLMPEYSDFIVPSIYAMGDDESTEGFDNSPRIFYNNYVKTLTSCTYFVPCQNAPAPCGDSAEDEYLQFSHLSTIPTVVTLPPDPADTIDFVFQSDQLFDPIGESPTDNLFTTYWLPYFNELYSPDTRIMKLKVNLSPSDVASFKFYDTVFIKNRTFRVNKIEYKPNTLAKVEFILIP